MLRFVVTYYTDGDDTVVTTMEGWSSNGGCRPKQFNNGRVHSHEPKHLMEFSIKCTETESANLKRNSEYYNSMVRFQSHSNDGDTTQAEGCMVIDHTHIPPALPQGLCIYMLCLCAMDPSGLPDLARVHTHDFVSICLYFGLMPMLKNMVQYCTLIGVRWAPLLLDAIKEHLGTECTIAQELKQKFQALVAKAGDRVSAKVDWEPSTWSKMVGQVVCSHLIRRRMLFPICPVCRRPVHPSMGGRLTPCCLEPVHGNCLVNAMHNQCWICHTPGQLYRTASWVSSVRARLRDSKLFYWHECPMRPTCIAYRRPGCPIVLHRPEDLLRQIIQKGGFEEALVVMERQFRAYWRVENSLHRPHKPCHFFCFMDYCERCDARGMKTNATMARLEYTAEQREYFGYTAWEYGLDGSDDDDVPGLLWDADLRAYSELGSSDDEDDFWA